MKTINQIAMIFFAVISLTGIVLAIVHSAIELLIAGAIAAAISYVAFLDTKHPHVF